MTRAKLSLVAGVFGLLFSLVLYGCGGNDDDAGFADIRGVSQVTSTQTNSGCSNPANNGTFTSNFTLNISSQNGADFSGTAQGDDGSTMSFTGQLTAADGSQGTITFTAAGVVFEEMFITIMAGTTNYTGRYIVGETCVFQGQSTSIRQ
jgi:hypothetical protein